MLAKKNLVCYFHEFTFCQKKKSYFVIYPQIILKEKVKCIH